MNWHIDRPWLAIVAIVLPFATATLFAFANRRRMKRLARLGGEVALARLAPEAAARAPRARIARLSLAAGLGAFALAGPRWGAGTSTVRTEGHDVVLAMDASLSMLSDDERPTRLEHLKREVRLLRAAAPGDRVALLAFAGKSYILSPLTNDDGAIDLFLDNLDPAVVGQAGTALAPTIIQATDLLRAARGAAGRAIVILTDGEAFDDHNAALAAARKAKESEIAVVTVGFGTEAGGTITIFDGSQPTLKRDETGQVVVTRYDPVLLRDVASAGGGEFIPATASDRGLRVNQALKRLDAQQRDVQEGQSRPLQLAWFLLPMVLLVLVDAWRADGGRAAWMRRALRVAVPVLILLAANSLPAQAPGDPMAAFKAKRYLEAAQRWRQKIAEGDKRPITLYNFGTAMLAADSIGAALEALERAAMSPDANVRERALYNLGLAHLRRARQADASDGGREASAAAGAYRSLLMQKSDDADARWNYELALRMQKQQQGGGGGNNDKDNQQEQQQQQQPRQQMSRQQAEQLLASAQRDEKETQGKRQRGTRQERPPGGKDW